MSHQALELGWAEQPLRPTSLKEAVASGRPWGRPYSSRLHGTTADGETEEPAQSHIEGETQLDNKAYSVPSHHQPCLPSGLQPFSLAGGQGRCREGSPMPGPAQASPLPSLPRSVTQPIWVLVCVSRSLGGSSAIQPTTGVFPRTQYLSATCPLIPLPHVIAACDVQCQRACPLGAQTEQLFLRVPRGGGISR